MREYMRAFRLARIVGNATSPPLSLFSAAGHENTLNTGGNTSSVRSIKHSAFASKANLDAAEVPILLDPTQSGASFSRKARLSSKWSKHSSKESSASGANNYPDINSPRSRNCKPPTKAALRAFAAASAAETGGVQWRSSGHLCIGRRVRRIFRRTIIADGTIACWVPAGPGADDHPLWRVLHDDGDTEDLEEHEMKDACRMYDTQAKATAMSAADQRGLVCASNMDLVLRSLAPLRLLPPSLPERSAR